jgi:ribosomal protein L40E
MGEAASGEVVKCLRCSAVLSPGAKRCSKCGGTVRRTTRPWAVTAAICGIVALLFMIVMMYRVATITDAQPAPVPADSEPTRPALGS